MKEKEITACLLKGRREHVAPLAPRKYHRLVGGYLLLTFLALLLALGNYKNIIRLYVNSWGKPKMETARSSIKLLLFALND